MNASHFFAALHLLTLGVGFGFLWMRARALAKPAATFNVQDVFFADNMYGIAALFWIATGFWRAFGGLEKGTDYYLHSTAFWIKMSLFALVFALEVLPMSTLIKWRMHLKKGIEPSLTKAKLLSLLSYAELVIISLMVFVAVLMARGQWY